MAFAQQSLTRNLRHLVLIITFFTLSPVSLFSQIDPVRYIAITQHKTANHNLSNRVDTAWVRRYDGPVSSEDVANSMVLDSYGNVYVTGRSQGSGTNDDYATIKYNSAGIEQWVARYDDSNNYPDYARVVTVDSSGNVYVTGSIQYPYLPMIGTIKYNSDGILMWCCLEDPSGFYENHGMGIALDTEGNICVVAMAIIPACSYWVIKYTPSGVKLWEVGYQSAYDEAVPSLAIDNQNNIFIAGESGENFPSFDYVVIKYSETGNQIWKKLYNGPADTTDFANAIVVDDSGNVYVTGQSMGTGSGYDYATIKYDNDGSQLWVARYNGSGNGGDKANAITVDNPGNIYVTGISEGDYATIKYDSNGIEQWVATYDGLGSGSDEAYSIVLDDSNNVYVTGKSMGSGTGYDYATIKYDSAGTEQWVVRYDGLGNGLDEAYSIAIDGSNNIYVAGKSMGSGTNYDYATIKYVQETGIEERDGSDSEVRYAELLTVTPNPFSKLTEIRYQLPDIQMQDVRSNLSTSLGTGKQDISLKIYDVSGRIVKSFDLASCLLLPASTVSWNGRDNSSKQLPAGVYFCVLKTGNINKTCRIILVK